MAQVAYLRTAVGIIPIFARGLGTGTLCTTVSIIYINTVAAIYSLTRPVFSPVILILRKSKNHAILWFGKPPNAFRGERGRSWHNRLHTALIRAPASAACRRSRRRVHWRQKNTMCAWTCARKPLDKVRFSPTVNEKKCLDEKDTRNIF